MYSTQVQTHESGCASYTYPNCFELLPQASRRVELVDSVIHFLSVTPKAQDPMLTNCGQSVRCKGWWHCAAMLYMLPRHCLCITNALIIAGLQHGWTSSSSAQDRPVKGRETYLHTICTNHAGSSALAVRHTGTCDCRRCRLHVHSSLAAYLCQGFVCCAIEQFLQHSR